MISLLSTTNLGKGVGGNGKSLNSVPLHHFVQVQDTKKIVFVFINPQYLAEQKLSYFLCGVRA